MGYKFKLNNAYYGTKETSGFHTPLYHRTAVTLQPGVTVLVGCNGSGKTTFLLQLKDRLRKDKIPYLCYDNLEDGGSNARSQAAFYEDYAFVATSMQSSEGENIDMNLGRFAGKIGNFIYNKVTPEDKEVFILFDAIDSGLSIDHIVSLKEDLFDFVIKDTKAKGIDLYFVVSANSYEMARGMNCFDIYNANYKMFTDYEEYREFILESRKRKDKRYGIK